MFQAHKFMSESKQTSTKEIFAPVIKKKYDPSKLFLHYHLKDVCWSIDLFDSSSLRKRNKHYKYIFTILDDCTKYAWAISPNEKSGKSTTTTIKNLVETTKRKPQELRSYKGEEF